jgi:Leucine-rich repeat (LRR) protein
MNIDDLSFVRFEIIFATDYKPQLSENAKLENWTVMEHDSRYLINTPLYTYSIDNYEKFYNIITSDFLNGYQDMKIKIKYRDNTENTIKMWYYFEDVIIKFIPSHIRASMKKIRNTFNPSSINHLLFETNSNFTMYLTFDNFFEFFVFDTKMSKENITAWLGFFVRFVLASQNLDDKHETMADLVNFSNEDGGTFDELFKYIDNEDIKQYFSGLVEEYNDLEYNRLEKLSKQILNYDIDVSEISEIDFINIARYQLLSVSILFNICFISENTKLMRLLVNETDGRNTNVIFDFTDFDKYGDLELLKSILPTTNDVYNYIVYKKFGINIRIPTTTINEYLIVIADTVLSPKYWKNYEFIFWKSLNFPIMNHVVSLSLDGIDEIPEQIVALINLKTLTAHKTLKRLPKNIGLLSKLEVLSLSGSQLVELPSSLFDIKTLQILELDSNFISHIDENIGNLINLIDLNLSANELDIVPVNIGQLHRLKLLSLDHNNIKRLPNSIGNLQNLQSLSLENNQLELLPESIVNLRQAYIAYTNNPNIVLSERILQFLNGGLNHLRHHGIYDDAQSVHNSALQQSIKTSIKNIIDSEQSMNSEQVLIAINNDPVLTPITKTEIGRYVSNKDLVSDLDVNYLDILTAVWNRIIINEHAVELKNRLNQEIMDCAIGHVCFTGRISRLVNCLAGMDDLVNIGISDSEQIGIIISIIKDTLVSENRYTVALHKSIVKDRLLELKYTQDVIDLWLSFIEETDEEPDEDDVDTEDDEEELEDDEEELVDENEDDQPNFILDADDGEIIDREDDNVELEDEEELEDDEEELEDANEDDQTNFILDDGEIIDREDESEEDENEDDVLADIIGRLNVDENVDEDEQTSFLDDEGVNDVIQGVNDVIQGGNSDRE